MAEPPTTNPRFLKLYNVKDYGAKGTGLIDDSVAVLAAITAVYTDGGGIVYFPRGTYKCLSQIVIPNDGTSIPNQPAIIFRGEGSMWDGTWQSSGIVGTTTLDLRYDGTIAKIDTRGRGELVIQDLHITDNGTSSLPFLQTTNTTLHVDRVSVWGNPAKSGTSTDQDAFVFGGTTTSTNGTSTAAFQGYGTTINNVFFNHIRRGVYLRAYANGLNFSNLTWGTSCGSTTEGAIEIDGTTGFPQSGDGNRFVNILIEAVQYTYPVVLKDSANNSFDGIKFWDSPANAARVKLSGTASRSSGNIFIGDILGLTDSAGGNTNTWIGPAESRWGTASSYIRLRADTGDFSTPGMAVNISTSPGSSVGMDANWNELELKSGIIGSIFLFDTALGGTHQPYLTGTDDLLTLSRGGFAFTGADVTGDVGALDKNWFTFGSQTEGGGLGYSVTDSTFYIQAIKPGVAWKNMLFAADKFTFSRNNSGTALQIKDGVSIGGTTDPGAGGLLITGPLIGTPQSLSGAGAVNLTTPSTAFTSTGGALALTLANGTAGQIKTICHVVDGGSGVLTPTTKSGYSTITFTNAGDSVTLQYHTTAGWCIIGSFGVTIA